ncbi:hypothetical protein [Burkholderia vietnamiensis]|uniref:hypothetical protein n=1 Tax=Burkholderia vietnamiensis TaxID=60552 RepID=UPI00158BB563|nr:hypothetical protein [Burkholderia vietnamiensis]
MKKTYHLRRVEDKTKDLPKEIATYIAEENEENISPILLMESYLRRKLKTIKGAN